MCIFRCTPEPGVEPVRYVPLPVSGVPCGDGMIHLHWGMRLSDVGDGDRINWRWVRMPRGETVFDDHLLLMPGIDQVGLKTTCFRLGLFRSGRMVRERSYANKVKKLTSIGVFKRHFYMSS
jgi:hypothetical protein